MRLRLRRFRRIKRGYYSFVLLVCAYAFTFVLPFFIGSRALLVQHDGTWYFPSARSYFRDIFSIGSTNIVSAKSLDQRATGELSVNPLAEANYGDLQSQYRGDAQRVARLSPLQRQRLYREEMSKDDLARLETEEQTFRDQQLASDQAFLKITLSRYMVKRLDPHEVLLPDEKIELHDEFYQFNELERKAFLKKFTRLQEIVSANRLALLALQGESLSAAQHQELTASLIAMPTPLEQAQQDGLNIETADQFVVMPFIPFGPFKSVAGVPETPFEKDISLPTPPDGRNWLGTDNSGRDLLARLVYGFRISITFALMVVTFAYVFGTAVGAILGYYGRWVDIIGQRFVEIWAAIPILYIVMILADIFGRQFLLLVGILTAFSWIGITYYVRGEFYREKTKDYVSAAIATGEGDFAIIFRYVLPNALTPIISFAPFAIVGTIVALVSLDFLGFGLPVPTPSWGEVLKQAKEAGMDEWHLVVFPMGAMFLTLQLVVFIGEAVREAFDPKVFSRLR